MSFVTPLFLIAAGAVAFPVIAHLVRRRRARCVPFSSLILLEASPLPLVRRRRLRDILLLALRSAMLVLLALAFARPFVPQEQLPFIPVQQSQSVVLLIDRSFSMQAGDRLDEARSKALRYVEEAGRGDEIAIVAFSDGAFQLTELNRGTELQRRVIADLQPTFRSTDYRAPLRMAADILEHATHKQRQVVLISDFQLSGFNGSMEDVRLPDNIGLVTETVDIGGTDNLFFKDLAITLHRSAEAVTMALRAQLEPELDHPVTLQVAGMQVDRRTDAPAGHAYFREQSVRMGYHQGSLRVDDVVLEADNTLYFTSYIAPRPVVLLVDGDPRRRNRFFLETAFELGEHAAFTLRQRESLTEAALRGADIVILSDLPTLSTHALAVLRSFVENGGGTLFSVGPSMDPAALAVALNQLGVTTAKRFALHTAEPASSYTLGVYDDRHPGVGSVFDHATRMRPRIRRYVAMEPDSGANVVARLNNGAPLLIESSIGAGKVLVLSTTFSSEWNDLPLGGAYVPLLHRLATYSFDTPAATHQYMVGDVVQLPADIEWDILSPDGNIYKADTGYFRETDVPGHYIAASGSVQRPFSVNIDPGESNLAARDEKEVYASIIGSRNDEARAPNEATLQMREEERKQKLWRIVILTVLGILLIESLLAGRSTRKEVPIV